jgi:Na+/H+ antiporter NhaD/arsenite permease-like protein
MDLKPTHFEIAASLCFFFAILHTFSVSYFQKLASRYKEGSVKENVFHLLGEVEIVFGIWAAIFLIIFAISDGFKESLTYLENRNFTEPLFVFTIMAVSATKPVLDMSEKLIFAISKIIPLPASISFYLSLMIIGPLLGSVITEPAAMTVTALVLSKKLYSQNISLSFKYATLGLLFVSISIGGTLTPYAAPPVLMVAPGWGWDLKFMLTHFGWKAIIAIVLSTAFVTFRFKDELKKLNFSNAKIENQSSFSAPWWIYFIHIITLVLVVMSSHHPILFIGIFLFFVGFLDVTKEYQSELKIKESLLVAFFLAGLVVLGGQQKWWLEPILTSLDSLSLYIGAMSLTAITDNAAITFLGSQVPNLSDSAKYALVAGSVVGGGLTVIANAPNPAGFSILNSHFGESRITALQLFKSAIVPTLIAALCFWVL